MRKPMIRLLCVTAWLSSAAFITSVQADDDETIVIAPRYSVGDTFTVQTEKKRSTIKNGKPTPAPNVIWDSRVEVVEEVESGFVLAWTRGEMRMDPPTRLPGAAGAFTSALIELWNNVRIDFVVSPSGKVVDIQNYDEMLEIIDITAENSRKLYTRQGMDPALIEQSLAAMKDVYADRQAGVAMLLKDYMGIFGLYGRKVYVSDVTVFETEIPNPFGGAPLPAKETWELYEWSDNNQVARFRWTQTVDKKKFAKYLSSMMSRLTPDQKAQQRDKIASMRNLKVTTSGQLDYEPGSGLIIYSYIKRETFIGVNGRRETFKWTVID